MSKPHISVASTIWIDPGETTGVAVLALDPSWIAGEGDADWAGLRRAIRHSYFVQVGFDERWWNGERAVPVPLTDEIVSLPTGMFNGPELRPGLANELAQVFAIREILDQWPGAAWGYEDYIPESMAAAQKVALTPMRVFAPLTFCLVMDASRARAPFVQDRSFKATANNDRLKEAGLYLPGMPHASDAARHAAVFARRARQKQEIRAAAWPRLFGKQGKLI